MKTAIILAGGGMRSGHGAGFLYAMATQIGITAPDLIIGTSGDAANVAYFAAQQYESMKIVWTEHVTARKFVNPWRFWRVLDIDYLVDTLFKKTEPLDILKLRASSIQWFIPVTDFDTGTTRYIGAKDNLDPFEVLRAAKAIPVLYGKVITLFDHRCIDGEIGSTLEDHIKFAVKMGATRVLVINHSVWTKKTRAAIRIYAAFTPEDMRRAIERDITTDVSCITMPNVTIVCVMAETVAPGPIIKDKIQMREIFDKGVSDALAIQDELRQLFTDQTPTHTAPSA